jgi:predicted transcriptional regulator
LEKQKEPNKNLIEQVAIHGTMIEEFIASISSGIKVLQHQAVGLDKALSKLVDIQATLLSMYLGKPRGPPIVGMNSITIAENIPSTLEEIYNKLINYTDLLEPLFVANRNS